MNGQIVCCKGVNDGRELRRSIEDLGNYLPFMKSVSVVPAGITKYRDGLYPIDLFTKEEAGEIIDLIESYQETFYQQYGLHFIHASDEWYILAQREFPEADRYDGYIQLENGVGMMRLLMEEFEDGISRLNEGKDLCKLQSSLHRSLSIATGKLAYSTMKSFATHMMGMFPGLHIHVQAIENVFFGETITVSGLVTGQDLVEQLLGAREQGVDLGDTLMIPSNMLRTGEKVFLDDWTCDKVEESLSMKLVPVETDGYAFLEAVMNPEYSMDRGNENYVYIHAYDR